MVTVTWRALSLSATSLLRGSERQSHPLLASVISLTFSHPGSERQSRALRSSAISLASSHTGSERQSRELHLSVSLLTLSALGSECQRRAARLRTRAIRRPRAAAAPEVRRGRFTPSRGGCCICDRRARRLRASTGTA